MTECPTEEQLSRYVASGGDDGEIAAHIRECPACRLWVEEARANEQLLRSLHQKIGQEGSLSFPHSSTAVEDLDATARPAVLPQPVVGYRILREIGRGGMGVVYQAEQEATRRTVALKMLLEGPFAGRASRRRFEREVELAVTLDHPNIATIYDSGLRQGRYYFAMDYIDGETLDAYVDSHDLSIKDRLRLVMKVCEAVSHAHQRGIIHRDLKPSNVRVDSRGEPHILDFGLAKMVEPAGDESLLVSVSHQVIGTFPYMAPEQVAASHKEVDVRTDVYALGLVLYKLLTGHFPYRVVGQIGDVVRNITESEPRPPSALNSDVDNEVETIVLKALAKEKERRYQSAGELAADIQRYLAGEPIEAKRDSGIYVFKKALRRHRLGFSVAAGILLLLVAFAVAMAWLYARAERNRVLANQRAAEAATAREDEQRARYHTTIALAESEARQGRFGKVPELLKSCPERFRGWEWGFLLAQCPLEERRIETGIKAPIKCAISRDGQWYAANTSDQELILWDLVEGREHWRATLPSECEAIAFHPKEDMLVTSQHGRLKKYDLATGERTFLSEDFILDPLFVVSSMAFTTDGRQLYCGSNEEIHLVDTDRWRVTRVFATAGARHDSPLAITPDGRFLASGRQSSSEIRIWDTRSGQLLWDFQAFEDWAQVSALTMTSRIIVCSALGRIAAWDMETRKCVYSHDMHLQDIASMVISPSQDVLAAGCLDGTTTVFDFADGNALLTLENNSSIRALQLPQNGDELVVADNDGNMREFAGKPPHNGTQDSSHIGLGQSPAGGTQVTFSSDGNILASLDYSHTVRAWNTRTWRSIGELVDEDINYRFLAFRPGTQQLAVGVHNRVRFYDAKTLKAVREIPVEGLVTQGEFDASGHHLAVTYGDFGPCGKDAFLIDLHGHQTSHRHFKVDDDVVVAISSDGTQVAMAHWHNFHVRVWDVATGQLIKHLRHYPTPMDSVTFHPRGKFLATGGRDGTIGVWDLVEGTLIHKLKGHTGSVTAIVFSPDGSRLFSTSTDYSTRVWDWQSGQQLLSMVDENYFSLELDFSDDGLMLAGTSASPNTWVKTALPWHDTDYPGDKSMLFESRVSMYRKQRNATADDP